MKRNALILISAVSVAGLMGCQKDQTALEKKLDDIDKRLAGIESTIKQGAVGAARPRARRPRGPDPSKVYSMPIEGDPYAGNENAKVTVVKGFDFACPYCERVRTTLDQLLTDYGDDIKIVYKHYVVHPQVATIPARAACAAQKQGKFLPMYEQIWEKGFKAGRKLGQDNMDKIASDIGLDMTRFKADIAGDCVKEVQQDQTQLAQVGARGTPAFFINGRFLSGARPIAQFKALIDEELKKANDRIAKGTPVSKYYDEWVVKKGLKRLAAQ